ncbi:hypothetical protein ACJ41O_006041 [Fusarium nematophilum]
MEEPNACTCPTPDRREIPGGHSCFGCGHTTLLERSGKSDAVSYSQVVFDLRKRPSCFVYRPLESPLAIRLIRLYPGSQQEDLQCEIFSSSLSDHPDYEGLSYVWGDSILSHEIYTDKGPLRVTRNCAAALKQLRHPFRDRVLWIDAICINQESLEEKSRQVPLMNKIFAEAKRVIIFLGCDSRPRLKLFFDYFRRKEPSSTNRVLQPALSSFLSMPWFSRVWVLQEVAVAKRAIILWGSETLEWGYLSAAHVDALGLALVDRAGKVPPVLRLAENDRKPLKDLASLIHTARSCRSTDPRDKVYALLGLLSDNVAHTLVPDYTISVEALHVEVALLVISSCNNLDALADVGSETREEMEAAHALRARVDSFELVSRQTANRIPSLQRRWAEAEIKARGPRAVALEAKAKEERAWRKYEDLRRGGDPSMQIEIYRLGERVEREYENLHRSGWFSMQMETEISSRLETPPQQQSLSIKGLESMGLLSNSWTLQAAKQDLLAAKLAERETISKAKTAWLEAREASAIAAGHELITEAEEARRTYQAHLPSSLFIEATRIIGRQLFSASRFSNGQRCSGLQLPSWVPDLSTHPALTSLSHFRTKPASSQPPESLARLCTNGKTTVLEIRILELDVLGDGPPSQLDDQLAEPLAAAKIQNYPGEGFLFNYMASPHFIAHGSTVASFQSFCQGRRRIQTERSWVICSGRAEMGDRICVIYGAGVPFVLRPLMEAANHYQLIGECYLHGIRGPKFVDDYLELMGDFRDGFKASTSDALPWQMVYLE